MEAKAHWASVKTNWTQGTSCGIVGEGDFDVKINRHLRLAVYREAESFLRQFNDTAEVVEIEEGAFEMRLKEGESEMVYVFRVLEYDVKEGQTLWPSELREVGKAIWFR